MAVIKEVDGEAVVDSDWWEACLAGRCCNPHVSVPLNAVRTVYVSNNVWQQFKWRIFTYFRIGAHLPGYVLLGSIYRRGGQRIFAVVYGHRPVIVLEMEPGTAGWSTIAVSHDNAEAVAAQLQAAVAAAKRATAGQLQVAADAAAADAAASDAAAARASGAPAAADAGASGAAGAGGSAAAPTEGAPGSADAAGPPSPGRAVPQRTTTVGSVGQEQRAGPAEQRTSAPEQRTGAAEQQLGLAGEAGASSAAAGALESGAGRAAAGQPGAVAAIESEISGSPRQHAQHRAIPIVESAERMAYEPGQEGDVRGRWWQQQQGVGGDAEGASSHVVVLDEQGVQLHEAAPGQYQHGKSSDSKWHPEGGVGAAEGVGHSRHHIVVVDEKGTELHEVGEGSQDTGISSVGIDESGQELRVG